MIRQERMQFGVMLSVRARDVEADFTYLQLLDAN